MTTERPYEMMHVAPKLRGDFSGHVSEAASGTTEEKEKNFLTRALAAYAIQKLTNCSIQQAAASVVDGGGDGGIDGIYFSPTASILWLVQSKYIDDGRGQPSLGDASKFKNGIEALIQGKFEAFQENVKWQAILPQVQAWLRVPALQIKAVIVYTGLSLLSEDRIRIFEDLQNRFNNDDNFLCFQPYGLASIDAWISGIDNSAGVEKIEIEVLHPGWFKEPYETILGRVRIDDLIKLYNEHGQKLIAANIRRYKGKTAVNEKIQRTATEEPENLFYLNNGMTAYCDRFEIPHEDRADAKRKKVTAYGLSIVNGAQTLGALLKAYPAIPATAINGFVGIKIISLYGCADDREFARRITESTNFQNQIGVRDFAAIDEQQERIATQLSMAGIEYHYKYGDDTPESDSTNFTLDDATIALACLEYDFEFCSSILADRKSLWSFDPIYPDTELLRSRYERLFHSARSARTVWKAVQTYQTVLDRVKAEARTSTGVRKAFFENGRWLILKILFVQLHPERGEDLTISAQARADIVAKTLEIGTSLWDAYHEQGFSSGNPHARSVFSNPEDCKRLYNATMAKLAALAASSAANTGT